MVKKRVSKDLDLMVFSILEKSQIIIAQRDGIVNRLTGVGGYGIMKKTVTTEAHHETASHYRL
jgi:hypothetical protein